MLHGSNELLLLCNTGPIQRKASLNTWDCSEQHWGERNNIWGGGEHTPYNSICMLGGKQRAAGISQPQMVPIKRVFFFSLIPKQA